MRQTLKERLVGAALLVLIGVIFIPMLLSGPGTRLRSAAPISRSGRPMSPSPACKR